MERRCNIGGKSRISGSTSPRLLRRLYKERRLKGRGTAGKKYFAQLEQVRENFRNSTIQDLENYERKYQDIDHGN